MTRIAKVAVHLTTFVTVAVSSIVLVGSVHAQSPHAKLRQQLIERVRTEYRERGGKSIDSIDLSFRKNGPAAPVKYSILSSYDLLIIDPQDGPAIVQLSEKAVASFLEGRIKNESWDSFTVLPNFPISEKEQPTARAAFREAQTQAERLAIVLALRVSPMTRDTSRFLADLLSDTDLKLRTAVLLALMPRSVHRLVTPQPQYDAGSVLTAIKRMVDGGFQPKLSSLILSILGEEPFVGSKTSVDLATRIHAIRSRLKLENEIMDFYWKRITAGK